MQTPFLGKSHQFRNVCANPWILNGVELKLLSGDDEDGVDNVNDKTTKTKTTTMK